MKTENNITGRNINVIMINTIDSLSVLNKTLINIIAIVTMPFHSLRVLNVFLNESNTMLQIIFGSFRNRIMIGRNTNQFLSFSAAHEENKIKLSMIQRKNKCFKCDY